MPRWLRDTLENCLGCTRCVFEIEGDRYPETQRVGWAIVTTPTGDRALSICDNRQEKSAEETLAPVSEQPQTAIADKSVLNHSSARMEESKSRSLFSISDDLEKLNELLDECGDDAQQQELINSWLEQLGEERDKKLDSYAALIAEMTARAEVRKAEAKRMMELASSDESRAKMLKNRLLQFFEKHNLKTVQTTRYKLQLQRNGGKAPLVLKEGVSPTELPERFQKVSIDPDTTAIREALERGEKLEFAQLGERGTSLRIK